MREKTVEEKELQAHHNKVNRKYSKKYKLPHNVVARIREWTITEGKSKDEIIKKFLEKIKVDTDTISVLKKANEHRHQAIAWLTSCKDFELEDLTRKIEKPSLASQKQQEI